MFRYCQNVHEKRETNIKHPNPHLLFFIEGVAGAPAKRVAAMPVEGATGCPLAGVSDNERSEIEQLSLCRLMPVEGATLAPLTEGGKHG
jgi:hypothetical protein